MSHYWKQLFHEALWIPHPTYTEKSCPDQNGHVFIVTGGNCGIGYQLCKILYAVNGTVYLGSRSSDKGNTAIQAIKEAHPDSNGKIELLQLDLADLTTIKKSVEDFMCKESRLDCLCNNAGVAAPPAGSKTAQGLEMQIGTNCLGPYLFTQLLKPILISTAKISPPNSVRVAWAGSGAIDLFSPTGGIVFETDGSGKSIGEGDIKPKDFGGGSWGKISNYAQSKTGNLYLANEFGKEVKDSGIVSVCFNPGALHTELQRHNTTLAPAFLQSKLLYPAIYGAYTELWCALSPDLTIEDNGIYVAPWGQKSWVRADVESSKTDGTCEKFWAWCQRETEKFM